jgi:hypothetical protein
MGTGRKWQPETLGQYHDLWAKVLLCAPDQFRDVATPNLALVPDQKAALLEEFGRLRSGFHFADQSLKTPRISRIAEELITMSLEAYLAGDKKTGAHTLAESEGLIWKSRAVRVKYGVEAERRAFGENVLYADTIISPYPYEGSSEDLGSDQSKLLAVALNWVERYQSDRKEFKYFSWVIDNQGALRRTSVEPREDEHQTFPPAQKALGVKRLKELASHHEIRAAVLVQIIGVTGGLVTYDLEQAGHPRVSARQLFKIESGNIRRETMRYHLLDSEFFV